MSPAAGRVEPRNPVEATLAQIWGDLLDTQAPVGVHDNLFALGGHSLTATRFVARVGDVYGVELPVHQVFAGPTIAELAEVIAAHPDFRVTKSSSRHAELDALSDGELDALLRAALAQRNRRRAIADGLLDLVTETGQRRRRRVQLTPMRSIPVEFTGQRAGEGPLTLGQLDVYTWLIEAPDLTYATLYAELPVPAVVSVDDVAGGGRGADRAARVACAPPTCPASSRASGSRRPASSCWKSARWARGSGDRGTAPRWPRRSSAGCASHPIRCGARCAWRWPSLPATGDRVIACAAGFSHLAVDHGAIEVLKRDFAGLLGDPARRQPAGRAGGPGHQPLDQAELEATRGRAAQGRRGAGLPAGAVAADPPLPVRPAGRPAQRRVAGGGAVVGGRRDGRAAGGGAHQDQPVQHRAGGHLRRGRPPRQLSRTGVPAGVKQPFRAPSGELRRRPGPARPRHRRDRREKLRRAGRSHLDGGDGGEPARQVRQRQAGRHGRADRARAGPAPQLRPVVQQPRP